MPSTPKRPSVSQWLRSQGLTSSEPPIVQPPATASSETLRKDLPEVSFGMLLDLLEFVLRRCATAEDLLESASTYIGKIHTAAILDDLMISQQRLMRSTLLLRGVERLSRQADGAKTPATLETPLNYSDEFLRLVRTARPMSVQRFRELQSQEQSPKITVAIQESHRDDIK